MALHFKTDIHREQDEGYPELRFEDRMFSVGLEDTITFTEKLYAIAGVSYDTIKTLQAENLTPSGAVIDFEKATTEGFNPQLGLFYTPVDNHSLQGSIAQKTRLPSLKDKYSYRLGTAIPNPDLDVEKSINYELGYTNSQFEDTHIKTSFFFNDVKDYIQFARVADPYDSAFTVNQNQNVGEVELKGLEMEVLTYLFGSLETGASYTYTHAENKSNSNKLTNIPKHKTTAYIRYTFLSSLTGQLDAEYNSKRYSSEDGSRLASEFTVVNTKLSYDFGNNIYAETGLSNVFDKDYALEEGYPEAGRTVFVNMRYIF